MISWTISVEPVTSKTASSFEYSSGGLVVGVFSNGEQPTASLGVRISNSTSRQENWSLTEQSAYHLTGTTIGRTVRGATSNVSGDSLTILATAASQTSTTATATIDRVSITISSTETYQAYTTTSFMQDEKSVTSTTFTDSERSFQRTTRTTSTAVVDLVTTTGLHLNNVAAATVYQANTGQAANANVIWVAGQATQGGLDLLAASSVAQSRTRTTIYPPSETREFSVVDASNTGFSFSNSLVSQSFTFLKTTVTEFEAEATTTDYVGIPQFTFTFIDQLIETQQTEIEETVFPSNSFNAVFTKTVTQIGGKWQTLNDTFLGSSCNFLYRIGTSRTAIGQDNFYTTSSQTISSETAPTAIYATGPDRTGQTSVAVGSPINRTTRHGAGVTGLFTDVGGYTTAIASKVSRGLELVMGVRAGSNNEVVGYYGANGISYSANQPFYSASRSVLTARPGTYEIFNQGSKIGTVSVNGLSGSATTTASDSASSSSGSLTFAIVPTGSPKTIRAQNTQDVAGCNGSLGVSETLYATVIRGVYKKPDGQTISKSHEISSFTSGSDINYLQPVTHFEPTSVNSSSEILWTAPRNSTALP